MSRQHPTLIRPPPPSPNKSPIEDVLELTPLFDIDPNLFTNTRPLWHPPGARGIYGGAVIAQCLAAAQRTVPANFVVHSMHCYFVLNGNSDIPIIYHVEHVREGRSFATRTVQARQRGQPIFTTTLSFMREGSGGKKLVSHAAPMPEVPLPSEEAQKQSDLLRGGSSPFISQRIDIHNDSSPHPHEKRTRQWLKARGRISEEGGYQAHLSALAYMSDSYFIGTVSRVHKLWRHNLSDVNKQKNTSAGHRLSAAQIKHLQSLSPEELRKTDGMDEDVIKALKSLDVDKDGNIKWREDPPNKGVPEVGMMVSLDHTIFFHAPKAFRADEWLFTEMDSPWSGDGRGLVHQRIFTKDGVLVATCVQEGVVRLKQDSTPKL